MFKRNTNTKCEIKTELISIRLVQHNPNINFDKYDWCQQFSQIVHADRLKSQICVSNEKVSIVKGKTIYQWGLIDKSYTVKQEKTEVLDFLVLDQRNFILDKDKRVINAKQTYTNIKAIRNFQNTLILLTQDNQLLDEKQNKLKQNIEDVQPSIEFLTILSKTTVTIAGKFPFQQSFDVRAQKISCGLNHVMCLTNEGQLYIWGEGKQGQIGNGTLKDQHWPLLVMTNVQDIAAGQESSLLIKGNKIYHCGSNELITQSQFTQYQGEQIFIRLFSGWSQNIDIQYAHYVEIPQDLYVELNRIVQTIQDDDLLCNNEDSIPQQKYTQSTNESIVGKKIAPPQIFGTQKSNLNKSYTKSKTPPKRLQFVQD